MWSSFKSWEEIVAQESYITFMAIEKPDGDFVEYQAKAMLTFDGEDASNSLLTGSYAKALETKSNL